MKRPEDYSLPPCTSIYVPPQSTHPHSSQTHSQGVVSGSRPPAHLPPRSFDPFGLHKAHIRGRCLQNSASRSWWRVEGRTRPSDDRLKGTLPLSQKTPLTRPTNMQFALHRRPPAPRCGPPDAFPRDLDGSATRSRATADRARATPPATASCGAIFSMVHRNTMSLLSIKSEPQRANTTYPSGADRATDSLSDINRPFFRSQTTCD